MSETAREITGRDRAAEIASLPVQQRYINRETSWLAFNQRVMEEARNEAHPLLERVRFLSISGTNLDEFYMVRVAGLHGQVAAGIEQLSDGGMTPAQQLAEVNRVASELTAEQGQYWLALVEELAAVDIHVVDVNDLTDDDRTWLEDYFLQHVFPVLTPLAIDPAHPTA